MHENLTKTRVMTAVDDLNIDSAGDNHEFVFAGPVLLTRVGFVVTTAVANAAGTVEIDIRRRPVAGADANHVELGTFTLTGTTTRAAGAVCWKDLAILDRDGETAEDGLTRNEAPNSNLTGPLTKMSPYIILPGQSLELDMGEVADSGAGRVFIEYIELPWSGIFIDGTNLFEDVTNA